VPTLASFEDVVKLIDARREIGLKLDVERYMRPIAFRPGAITFEPAPGAPANLAGRLVAKLKEWTGQPWLVAAEGGGGAETMLERERRERAETRAAAAADPFVASVLAAFPGAELTEVRQTAVPVVEAAPDDDSESEETP
jgi:DNA polymerase-3 subunit gamma/tau